MSGWAYSGNLNHIRQVHNAVVGVDVNEQRKYKVLEYMISSRHAVAICCHRHSTNIWTSHTHTHARTSTKVTCLQLALPFCAPKGKIYTKSRGRCANVHTKFPTATSRRRRFWKWNPSTHTERVLRWNTPDGSKYCRKALFVCFFPENMKFLFGPPRKSNEASGQKPQQEPEMDWFSPDRPNLLVWKWRGSEAFSAFVKIGKFFSFPGGHFNCLT